MKFEFLYARLLLTYEKLSSEYKAYFEADGVKPNLARWLPDRDDEAGEYYKYANWLSQYAALAFVHATQSVDESSDKYKEALLELESWMPIGDLPSTVSCFALDHAWINQKLKDQSLQKDIDGRQVVREVGSGGEGLIVQVEFAHSPDPRVMKLPKPIERAGSDNPFDNVLRLVNEGRTLLKLSDQGLDVVKVYNVSGPDFPDRSLPAEEQLVRIRHWLIEHPIYVEMKYYQSGSLKTQVGGVGLDLVKSATWGLQIARTLAQVHRDQILHRDLKFDNCLLDNDKVLLADFGLSRNYTTLDAGGGFGQGTPRFMAPEQLDRDGVITEAVDMWALGVMLYCMWTGSYPFEGNNPAAIKNKILKGTYPKLQSLRPDLPQELIDICKACLRPTPLERYDANKVFTELRKWLESQGQKFHIKKYGWNPQLIRRLTNKQMVFMLLEMASFGDAAFQRLSEILEAYDCMIFRIYRILGTYDVLVRAYMNHSQLDRLVSAVNENEKDIRPITFIKPYNVSNTMLHWYWTQPSNSLKAQPDPEDLVSIESYLGIDNWENDPIVKNAIRCGIVRPINEDGDKKIFFVFINETRPVPSRKAMLDVVKSAFFNHCASAEDCNAKPNTTTDGNNLIQGDAREPTPIFHESIYEIATGPTLAILKAEVTDFFAIGELVSALSDALAASGCSTETHVAANRNVYGREQLNPRALRMRPTTRMLQDEFPDLYARWLTLPPEVQDARDQELANLEEIVSKIIFKYGKNYFSRSKKKIISPLLFRRMQQKSIDELIYRLLYDITTWVNVSYSIVLKKQRDKKQSVEDGLFEIKNELAVQWNLASGKDYKRTEDKFEEYRTLFEVVTFQKSFDNEADLIEVYFLLHYKFWQLIEMFSSLHSNSTVREDDNEP